MKIAIIRKQYTFHGGAEGFSQNLTYQLAQTGHDIHLYAIKWEGSPPLSNIHLHKVPAFTFNSTMRDLSFALSTTRLLKRLKFDIIQSHDKTLYQDIYRAGDGCHIEWLRQRWKRTGLFGKCSILCNPYHWLILFLENRILKGHRFKKVLAISELVKKNIMEHYQIDDHDIKVIYNGVDLERFNPINRNLYRKEIRKQYNIPNDAFVVLFVGSGFERKGLEFLLLAVELIPYPLFVLIVGKGPENRYRNLIQKQQVIFCGPKRDVQKYYAASDIFVFPTIYEPFGNVHLEALASGLPVITTKLSGAAEILQEGVQGFAIPLPENYKLIADKIDFVMNNKQARESMSLNARKLAESFSMKRYLEELSSLYQEVMHQR